MSNKTVNEANNALKQKAKTPLQKGAPLKNYVSSMLPAFKKALPNPEQARRFERAVLTALRTNPKLNDCTPESFCAAMMQSAQLGLIPNTAEGLAYLIPYKNECQFILGYQGLIQLVWRSQQVSTIQAHMVYENDVFEYSYGLHPQLYHIPCRNFEERGKPIMCYASFETISGGFGFEVMSIEEVIAHGKKFSSNFNSRYSPWQTSFESMALKTVLKRALKYAPISTEFNRQLASDETIKRTPTSLELIEEEDVLDLPNEFEYVVEEPHNNDTQNKEINAKTVQESF